MKKENKDYSKVGNEFTSRKEQEIEAGNVLRAKLLETLPHMGSKWDIHLPLFLTPASLARLLWLDTVYKEAIHIPGCLVEFGSQWGASINTFCLLKQIHEPWNAGRRLLSFSLFEEGFLSVDEQDGNISEAGDYRVSKGWDEELRNILYLHSQRSPLGAGSGVEVIPGDAVVNFREYLESNPELMLSHVHFDMDLYKPTRDLIEICLKRMPKGGIMIFDELNCPSFPGETTALDEVIGINQLKLIKSKFQPYSAYAVVGS